MRFKPFLIVLVGASLAGCSGSSNDQSAQQIKKWYEGGSLQQATLGEWRIGSEENRLASSADFAAVGVKHSGRKLKSMEELRPIAESIQSCISKAGTSRQTDTTPVSQVATACVVLLQI